MEIIDFEKSAERIIARDYGGKSCRKKEMLYEGKRWLIKYPSNLRSLREKRKGRNIPSYSMSSVSEWLGSHIYDSLGIPVHNTMLGYLDNKLVVACEHLHNANEILLDMRGLLKSWANDSMYSEMGRNKIEISYILDMLSKRQDLAHLPLHERFWDMFVVDCFIGNPDRNMSNWSVIRNEHDFTMSMCPVYDNGSSFNCKLDPLNADKAFTNWEIFRTSSILNSACPFLENGNQIVPISYLKKEPQEGCIDAIGRIIPEIDLRACSELVKELYEAHLITKSQSIIHMSSMTLRFKKVLKPVYEMHFGELPERVEYISPSY